MVGGVLFQGIAEEEQRTLLDCLQARARHYARGETVLRAGEPTQALGVVVSGSVHIESSDAWGNRSILDKLGPGQIFAEVYACIPGERLMVTVVAAEDTEVLLLRVVQQLSYDEIAQALSLESGTVKSRISRARRQLREILLRQGNFFPDSAVLPNGKEG